MIGGDRYLGIIKGMDKENTLAWFFMRVPSWHSKVNDAIQKMTYPPIRTQLELLEISSSSLDKQRFHLWYYDLFYYLNKIIEPAKGKSDQFS